MVNSWLFLFLLLFLLVELKDTYLDLLSFSRMWEKINCHELEFLFTVSLVRQTRTEHLLFGRLHVNSRTCTQRRPSPANNISEPKRSSQIRNAGRDTPPPDGR